MKIRKAIYKDSLEISKLILNTLNKINKNDYEKKQFAIEKRYHCINNIKKELKSKIFFVLDDKNKIIGVVQLDLKEKTIDRLFLNPKFIGKGLGKMLMDYVEDYALKNNIKQIILYPTDYSLDFYKKMGYVITKEFIGTRNGGYPVIEMQKRLK